MSAPEKKERAAATLAAMWDMLTAVKTMARSGEHDFLTYLIGMAEEQCAEEARKLRSKGSLDHQQLRPCSSGLLGHFALDLNTRSGLKAWPMRRQLASQLRAYLDSEEGQSQSDEMRAILAKIAEELVEPHDRSDPLAELDARAQAATLLQTLYGDRALALAQSIEKRSGRTFAKLVTRRLDRLKREAGN